MRQIIEGFKAHRVLAHLIRMYHLCKHGRSRTPLFFIQVNVINIREGSSTYKYMHIHHDRVRNSEQKRIGLVKL